MLQIHSKEEWYDVIRKHYPDNNLSMATSIAISQHRAEQELLERRLSRSESSQRRIDHFYDEFVRSEYVANFTAERDSDFINEPERAARCYDAAEYGADGKTHAEVIEDWRDAFSNWMSDRQRWGKEHNRFEQGVLDKIEECELWHYFNGSLYQEIG